MADTRADVSCPAGVWVNLYAASGIAVGTAVDVWNKGNYPANLVIKSTSPSGSLGIPIFSGPSGSHRYVTSGESGLWAYSDGGTHLSVQVGA
jgi:hypothetical protein